MRLMSDVPGDSYMPLVIGLMIAFVAGAILFILTAEFVRRRTSRQSNDHDPDLESRNKRN
jgi:uncharacterized integral membrane protein